MTKPDATQHRPDPAYLRDLLAKAGVSQRSAAEQLGMSAAGLQNYIRDTFDPKYRAAPYVVQYALEALATHGRSIDDYSTEGIVTMSNESPYYKYNYILLEESYSTARHLQDFVLSCYNGSLAHFRGDALANFDARHWGIFKEFAAHYYKYREQDPELLKVGAAMWDQRLEWGRRQLAELAEHRAMDPKDYDGTVSDYRQQLQWLEESVEDMRKKGWISSSQ